MTFTAQQAAPRVEVRTPPIVLADVEVKGRECYATCRECGTVAMNERIGKDTVVQCKKGAIDYLATICPRKVRHETREALIPRSVKLWAKGLGGMRVPVKLFGKEAATISGVIPRVDQQAATKVITIWVYGEVKDEVERSAMVLKDLGYSPAIDPTCPWRNSNGQG